MQRSEIDTLLKSSDFKRWSAEVEAYAKEFDLPVWSTKLVLISVAHDFRVARRWAMRRSNYRKSRAWTAYQRLLTVGIWSTDPDGVAWTPGTEPWESDPIKWLHEVIRVADGNLPDPSLPRHQNCGASPDVRT